MSEDKDKNVCVVEQAKISSESDTCELPKGMDDIKDLQNSSEGIQQLEGLMRSTLKKTELANNDQSAKTVLAKHVRRLEAVEYYIQHFLNKSNMNKTFNLFQKESY
jgi:tRNA U34 5-carboxymethylaminomethyl modifying GTPase MnmE/TrmE